VNDEPPGLRTPTGKGPGGSLFDVWFGGRLVSGRQIACSLQRLGLPSKEILLGHRVEYVVTGIVIVASLAYGAFA